jgi:DNA-binding protein H-NS
MQVDYLAHYRKLRAEIARLENEAQDAQRLARAQAIQQILDLMQSAGMTVADLEVKPRPQRAPWGTKTRGGVPVAVLNTVESAA